MCASFGNNTQQTLVHLLESDLFENATSVVLIYGMQCFYQPWFHFANRASLLWACNRCFFFLILNNKPLWRNMLYFRSHLLPHQQLGEGNNEAATNQEFKTLKNVLRNIKVHYHATQGQLVVVEDIVHNKKYVIMHARRTRQKKLVRKLVQKALNAHHLFYCSTLMICTDKKRCTKTQR